MVPFRILSLGGGGTKGFLHIGALQELEFRVKNLTQHFVGGVYGSSVGAVMATAIAFGATVEQIKRVSMKTMSLGFVTDLLDIQSLKQTPDKKGAFEIESLGRYLISAFLSEGIDLRDKLLSDAKIPLFIIASNITKGVPTIFKGSVPVITVLCASCCIPFIFRPQLIGTSLYIDGGAITNIMMDIIPKEHREDTLSISLIHTDPFVTPRNLENIGFVDYLYKLYKISCLYEHGNKFHKNNINLYFTHGMSGVSDPSDDEKEEMVLAGRCIMRGFLAQRRG